MNVGELRALLEDFDDECEVRIAHQPRWPFEYSIGEVGVVEAEDDANGIEKPGVVYIAEGSQLGYLPDEARDAVGWS